MDIVAAASIKAFGREEWNRLFPGELEDWNYYRAVECAGLADFAWRYFGVRESGRLCVAVPGFITDYELDTTLSGPLRRVSNAIVRVFPRLLRVRMLALGSPVAECCHLGFATELDAPARQRALDAMLAAVEEHADKHRIGMLAIKDATAAQNALWAATAGARRLRRQPGLPTATLTIAFDSIDGYLRTLSRATRRDLRRKLKAGAALRVEWRRRIDDIIDDVMLLYRSTLTDAQFSFEELTADYFIGVLREADGHAHCVTYWLGKKLVAFNLVLHDGTRLLDKFLGMDRELARAYNLYFYTWIENVRWCIEHGVPLYQSGQGLHHEKRRLGSRLSANWLWYRHRNRVLDAIFVVVERLARLDRHDPELAALLKEPPA
ncbi:MAG: GNAT family N-acetyltransferase [Rudaea sp.]